MITFLLILGIFNLFISYLIIRFILITIQIFSPSIKGIQLSDKTLHDLM